MSCAAVLRRNYVTITSIVAQSSATRGWGDVSANISNLVMAPDLDA